MNQKDKLDDILHDFIGDDFSLLKGFKFQRSVSLVQAYVAGEMHNIIALNYVDYIAEYLKDYAIYQLSLSKYCEDGFYDESEWAIFDGMGISVDDVEPAVEKDRKAEVKYGRIISRVTIVTHNPLRGGYQE